VKQITFTKQATRTLRNIPRNVAARIVAKIEQYAENPESLANVVIKLQGRDGYRLRVGDWRVIFDEDGTVLAVLAIGPRGGICE
jgi:mRNA interferase RelE/StbE